MAVADFNNDLRPDLYVARPASDRIFLGTENGELTDWTDGSGINEADNTNGVNVVAGDFDNDMDVDVFVVRSRKDGVNLPDVLYDNQGDGTFVEVANVGGAAGTNIGDGDTVTTADYDLDGFLDFFVTNGAGGVSDGPNQLFRNEGNSNNWLEIDLEGVDSNRDGVGAQVFVTAGGVTQLRQQSGGVHKWAQNHQRLHFGLAGNTQVESIEIYWPSGTVQTLEGIDVNQVLKVVESETEGNGGGALSSPTRIEAEDYITGGQGIGYFDTTSGNTGGAYRSDDVDIQVSRDQGGGFNVGWIRDGEWLIYDLDLAVGGEYNLVARVASAKSSPHELTASAEGETAAVSFGATGGWQSWEDVTVGSLNLAAGAQQLRVDFNQGSFNLNYLDLVPV